MKKAKDLWTRENSYSASAEGWDLFTRDDGLLEIECIDERDACPFDGDDAAVRHVYKKAGQGSNLHLLAVHLDRRPADNMTWVPPEMLVWARGVGGILAEFH